MGELLTIKWRGINFNYSRSYNHLISEIEKRKAVILCAQNYEKLLCETVKIFDSNFVISYNDGIFASLFTYIKGLRVARIAGADLWLELIGSMGHSKRILLIGSTEAVINQTKLKLLKKYPSVMNILAIDGFQGDDKYKELILSYKPELVFVALGSPKQELLANQLFKVHPAFYMGLGGSFDVFVGEVKRAPRLFRRIGLEGVFRLISEPIKRRKRLLRILKTLPLMIYRVLKK